MEEDTLNLSVQLTKCDQKVKWTRNGRVLPIATNELSGDQQRFAGRVFVASNDFTHTLTIKQVQLKDAGEFTVSVEEISSKCNVTVKECEKLPRVDLTQLPKIIKVRAGKEIKIEIPYDSFPIPLATWRRNSEPLDSNHKGLKKNENKKATLNIEKSERKDKGQYELILTNSKGETKIPIEIEVLDKPGSPNEPLKVTDITNQTATLSWQSPTDDGGSPVENYIIEKMDASKPGQWQPVETVAGNVTQAKISKLSPLKQYKFRVRAVNKEGEGPNLETLNNILAKNPFDEPGKPSVPEIVDWDKDKIDIEWKAPEKDGGAPIEKYIIEKKEKNKGNWTKATEVMHPINKVSVGNLAEGKEYEFRVIAVNKGGPSEPSETSRGQLAKSRFGIIIYNYLK